MYSSCKACRREYYQENKEQRREYNRKYNLENTESVTKRKREHYQANKEASVEYYQENKKAIAEYKRGYYQATKENRAEQIRKYRQTPIGKEKRRASESKRRAIKSGLEGHYTAEHFTELCELSNNRCVCCGKKRKLTADHIIPITWENSNNFITNIQPLCKSCNSAKGNHHDTDYRTEEMILWAGE